MKVVKISDVRDDSPISGYECSRAWFDFCFENPDLIKPIHTAIYLFAVEHCNRLGWKKRFGFPTMMAMEALGIKSVNTYVKAFNELVEFGFIQLVEKSKNQYSSNVIALSVGLSTAVSNAISPALSNSDKALDKAFIKHTTKHLQSTDTINKQINNKQINNNTPLIPPVEKSESKNREKESSHTLGVSESDDWRVVDDSESKPSRASYTPEFEKAWVEYERKGSKSASFTQWKKLKPKDRLDAVAYIPAYFASAREVIYRKDFERYLRNRLWEDKPVVMQSFPWPAHIPIHDAFTVAFKGIKRVDCDFPHEKAKKWFMDNQDWEKRYGGKA